MNKTVIVDYEAGNLRSVANMLNYLKDLGVTTLYMLPFADSPMEDSGFDVKNPTDIRKDLGGREQFESFIKKAKEQFEAINKGKVHTYNGPKAEWQGNKYLIANDKVLIPKFEI